MLVNYCIRFGTVGLVPVGDEVGRAWPTQNGQSDTSMPNVGHPTARCGPESSRRCPVASSLCLFINSIRPPFPAINVTVALMFRENRYLGLGLLTAPRRLF